MRISASFTERTSLTLKPEYLEGMKAALGLQKPKMKQKTARAVITARELAEEFRKGNFDYAGKKLAKKV
ncbi:MAG: hypothetical protein LBB36_02165 [Fibromonadaceae bacterium]|jgi:hypothetical protein|nr:hypothetical protein [Fibromonadaceae bacterium]